MKLYTDLMIDLETLSTRPDAMIIEVGLCFFNADDGQHEQDVLSAAWGVSPHSWVEDFHIDPTTVGWWMSQSDEAREKVAQTLFGSETGNPASALPSVLCSAFELVEKHATKTTRVWANSPSFDLVILRNAARECGLDVPWAFWQERDFRTLTDLAGVRKEDRVPPTVPHSAEADAVAQALTAQRAYARILVQ